MNEGQEEHCLQYPRHIFPPPCLNQHINIVCFVFSFLKSPEILRALFSLWLSSERIFVQKIFSAVVFQGARAHFILTTSALYRAMQNRRVGRGDIYLRKGRCFISMKKKNQCFKNLPWREKSYLYSPGYGEENRAGVKAMPLSEAILPAKDSLCNVMFLTMVKISPHPLQWKCGPTLLFTHGMLWCYATQTVLETEDKTLRASFSCLLPLQHVSFSSRQSTEG